MSGETPYQRLIEYYGGKVTEIIRPLARPGEDHSFTSFMVEDALALAKETQDNTLSFTQKYDFVKLVTCLFEPPRLCGQKSYVMHRLVEGEVMLSGMNPPSSSVNTLVIENHLLTLWQEEEIEDVLEQGLLAHPPAGFAHLFSREALILLKEKHNLPRDTPDQEVLNTVFQALCQHMVAENVCGQRYPEEHPIEESPTHYPSSPFFCGDIPPAAYEDHIPLSMQLMLAERNYRSDYLEEMESPFLDEDMPPLQREEYDLSPPEEGEIECPLASSPEVAPKWTELMCPFRDEERSPLLSSRSECEHAASPHCFRHRRSLSLTSTKSWVSRVKTEAYEAEIASSPMKALSRPGSPAGCGVKNFISIAARSKNPLLLAPKPNGGIGY